MRKRIRPLWPTDLRRRILKEFDHARKHRKRGVLTFLCKKYGIKPQHEQQWRKAESLKESAG